MWESEPKKEWLGRPIVVMFLGENKSPSYHLLHSFKPEDTNTCIKMRDSMSMDEVYFKVI